MSTLDAKYDRFLEREFNYTEVTENNDRCIRDFFKFLNGGILKRGMINNMIFANGHPLKDMDPITDNVTIPEHIDVGVVQNRVHDIWMMQFLISHRDELELYLL
jgi:hypothetical protein